MRLISVEERRDSIFRLGLADGSVEDEDDRAGYEEQEQEDDLTFP